MSEHCRLAALDIAGKVFASTVMLMLALGMAFAGAQTYVKQIRHDLKAYSEQRPGEDVSAPYEDEAEKERKPLFDEWRFQWLLTYTHIHSFSMSFIFFFAGALYLMSAASTRAKIIWNALAFGGIVLDLGGLWLRHFCAPPWVALQYVGGTLMGAAFLAMFVKVMRDLWITPKTV